MRSKLWIYALMIIIIIATALVRARLSPETPVPSEVVSTPAAPTPQPTLPNEAPAKFPTEAQTQINKCLGETIDGFPALETYVAKSPVVTDELEWKVAEFEEKDGQVFRARLAREKTESGGSILNLSLMKVDEEGLPDRVPFPSGPTDAAKIEALDTLLREKRLSSEVETRRIRYADGTELLHERENGRTHGLTLFLSQRRLSCVTTQAGDITCHCVR